MADEKSKAVGEKELVGRLERIETKLVTCELLRQRQRRLATLGGVIIVLVFGVFVYRLIVQVQWYRAALKDPAQREKLFADVLQDSNAKVILAREGDEFLKQLKRDVLPEVEKAIALELDRQTPKLKSAVVDMGGRLQEHAEKELQNKLVIALVGSMEDMDTDLQKVFPDFDEKEIAKQIETNKQVFVDELHNLIEERLAKVQTSLETLKHQVSSMGEQVAQQGLTTEQSEALFIDALMELLAYELKPDLGKELLK